MRPSLPIRSTLIGTVATMLAGLFLAGCPKPPAQEIPPEPTSPELTLTVASLDLSTLNRRMTKADIVDLWTAVNREKIEVLTVQNFTRYPNVATRVDLVKEFGALSDWRSAFGELVDNSGAQQGNAVFAAYPIRSHAVRSFSAVKGAFDEGSVYAIIDGGVRDIMVVSALFPEKGGEAIKQKCFDLILTDRVTETTPMIVSGNLPRSRPGWMTLPSRTSGTPVLYDGAGSLEALRAWGIPTKLGQLTASTFGIFRRTTKTNQ